MAKTIYIHRRYRLKKVVFWYIIWKAKMPAAPKQKSVNHGGKRSEYQDKEKPTQIRFSNINAAKGLFTSIFLWFWGVNSHVFDKIEKLEFDTVSFMVLRKIMQFWIQGFIICINQLSNRMFRKKRAPSCLSLRILGMKMSVSWHVHKNSISYNTTLLLSKSFDDYIYCLVCVFK